MFHKLAKTGSTSILKNIYISENSATATTEGSLNLVMVETSVFGAKLPISNIIALTLFSDISNQNLTLPQDSRKLHLQSSRSRREISFVFLGFSSTWDRKWIYMRTYFRQKSKKHETQYSQKFLYTVTQNGFQNSESTPVNNFMRFIQ